MGPAGPTAISVASPEMLRAGAAHAVVAEIGAAGGVEGPVALGAVGDRVLVGHRILGSGLRLLRGDGAADQRAGREPRDAGRCGVAPVAAVCYA